MESVAMEGFMEGLSRQVLGEHSGNKVLSPRQMSVDNRDSRRNNKSEMPHELICLNLVHFTENEFADKIGLLNTDEPFCFKPFPWKFSRDETLQLTWWSPLPPDNWKNALNEDDFYDFDRIGNSPAINGASLCGPIGFVIQWKDILGQYAIGRGLKDLNGLELRNLATCLYKKEIMFAVLVCIEGDMSDDRFPVITSDDETEAFRGSIQSDNFIWKVYRTLSFGATYNAIDGTMSWDHLTFAFYCPTSNLNIQPQFCSIIDKAADKYRPRSRTVSKLRTCTEMAHYQDIITSLNDKIQKARNALMLNRPLV